MIPFLLLRFATYEKTSYILNSKIHKTNLIWNDVGCQIYWKKRFTILSKILTFCILKKHSILFIQLFSLRLYNLVHLLSIYILFKSAIPDLGWSGPAMAWSRAWVPARDWDWVVVVKAPDPGHRTSSQWWRPCPFGSAEKNFHQGGK